MSDQPRSGRPPAADCNRLWALSGNVCAFPDCARALTEATGGSWVTQGEIAHIRARSPGGPRHSAAASGPEADSYANTILLCREHHKLVDSDPERFPVDLLEAWKHEHEALYRESPSSMAVRAGILIPPPRARPFIERPSITAAAAVSMISPGSRLALSGISGSGKSQLAIEVIESVGTYAFRCGCAALRRIPS